MNPFPKRTSEESRPDFGALDLHRPRAKQQIDIAPSSFPLVLPRAR